MRRLELLRATARRFGGREAATVLMLWILRQLFDYRLAVIFVLDLAALRARAPEHPFVWELQDGSFNGRLGGCPCYESTVSLAGFQIKGRYAVCFRGDGDAYTGDCLTRPEFRGLGVYPSALAELGVRLHAAGRERLCLFVERDNLASIQGVRKAGFHAVATCRVMRIPGLGVLRRWRTLPGGQSRIEAWAISPDAGENAI